MVGIRKIYKIDCKALVPEWVTPRAGMAGCFFARRGRKLDFDDTALCGDDNGLRSVVNVEPPQYDVDVPLDGSPGDIQRLGNFLIAESFYD